MINLIKPKIGGYPKPLRKIGRNPEPLWHDRTRIHDAVAAEMVRLHSCDLMPWFINIDADWWDDVRRIDDPTRPAVRMLPSGDWTLYGLPVLVWAPGSPQSRGFTIHAYPPTWPRR